MGNYNLQYENYYKGIKNKRNNMSNYKNRDERKWSRFFYKRVLIDLAGVLVLLTFVICCKLIVTPKTQAAYNYSKKIVDENYDYANIYAKAKRIDINKIESKVTNWIENMKSKITGEKTVKEVVSQNFQTPLKGKITSSYGYRKDPFTGEKKLHEGVDIDAKEGTEVHASYDGKIKDCGEDKDFGKYILIDHGKGIETKYCHLNEITIKKGDEINKNDVIGKSGNTGKSTGAHLHFELLYMGENKNPEEFITIN